MSVQATTWVWDHSQARGTDRLVLLAIADAANKYGHRSCQSAATLADMCKISSRTAQRSIQKLLDDGEIRLEGKDFKYQTNVYSLPGVSGFVAPNVSESGDTSDCRTDSYGATTPAPDATPNEAGATTNKLFRYDTAMSPYPNTPSTPSTRKGPAKKNQPLPANWEPTAEHVKRAAELNLDVRMEADKFRNNAEDKGRMSKSWNAAFTNWLIKADEFRGTARGYGKPAPAERMAGTAAMGALLQAEADRRAINA